LIPRGSWSSSSGPAIVDADADRAGKAADILFSKEGVIVFEGAKSRFESRKQIQRRQYELCQCWWLAW
jgi:hypothetical protein